MRTKHHGQPNDTALWHHRTEFLETSAKYKRNKGLADITRWHCECDRNECCSKLHREGTARGVPSRVRWGWRQFAHLTKCAGRKVGPAFSPGVLARRSRLSVFDICTMEMRARLSYLGVGPA